MFKEKVLITTNDVDFNKEVKLSSLFLMMQKVATDNVDHLKMGRDELMKNNRVWVVIRTEVQLYRPIKVGEEITITTHPGEVKSFIYTRYFQIYDKKNNLIANSSSTWLVIDFTTRRIVPHPFEDRKMPEYHHRDDLPLPEKITQDASRFIYERVALYSETDVNEHINNTKYVDYVLDCHNLDFYRKYRVCRIVINFDKEIHPGENIKLYSNDSNPEVVIGKVNDKESFKALVEYQERNSNL